MYVKHGNLVDADASRGKASTKHPESRLEVIQGHAFHDHRKADEGCIIMWALESEISKERSEHLRFRELHCHSASPLWEYSHKAYTFRNYIHSPSFSTARHVSIPSFAFVVGFKIRTL